MSRLVHTNYNYDLKIYIYSYFARFNYLLRAQLPPHFIKNIIVSYYQL